MNLQKLRIGVKTSYIQKREKILVEQAKLYKQRLGIRELRDSSNQQSLEDGVKLKKTNRTAAIQTPQTQIKLDLDKQIMSGVTPIQK